MKHIAIEEHMLPADIMRAAGVDATYFLGERIGRGLDDLRDGGDTRIGVLDRAGIDMQVLSAGAHPIQELEPTLAGDLSRRLNDTMAQVSRRHPDRFRFFATLPMSDPAASVGELRRAVEEQGAVGAMIHGQTRGVFLDDPSTGPLLAEIERLEVPLYLHPGNPPEPVRRAYFSGLDEPVAQMLSVGGWGWHAEAGMHVLRLVCNRVFDRHPGLQVIVGHMGENLPFSLARADEWLTPLVPGLEGTVAEQVLDHVHLTISGYTTPAPLLCAQAVFGADRMLFAVDYPYSDSAATVRFLADAPVSPGDREKIAHRNAETLLGLPADPGAVPAAS